MRYVESRVEEFNREETYRIYVSKALQLIPQNKYLAKDYLDMMHPKKEDPRSGEDIAADVMAQAGLHFGEIKNECI